MFSVTLFNDEDHSTESYGFKTGDETRILSTKGYGSKQKGLTKLDLTLSAREAWIVHYVTGQWLYKHFGEAPAEDFLTDEEMEKINRIQLTEMFPSTTDGDKQQ